MAKDLTGKCPLCQEEFSLQDTVGKVVCPACGKEVGKEQAVKYAQSLNKIKEEEKIVAHGEDYHKVELIVDRAEFFIEKGDYQSAKKELLEALKLTNSYWRLWFDFVKIETENFTNYRSNTFAEYLNKALECADEKQKALIKAQFSEYYQRTKLSDEQLKQLKNQEESVEKQMIEDGIKELIPIYVNKQKKIKNNLYYWIISFGVSALLAGGFLAFKITALIIASAIAIGVGYVFFRKWFTDKELVIVFNELIDLFDGYPNFDLNPSAEKDLIASMSSLCEAIYDKEPYSVIMMAYGKTCVFLNDLNVDKVKAFISSHKHMAGNV